MAHFRRARWGVRRTFQTEQAIESLSVYHNVAMIHEHSKLSGSTPAGGRAGRHRDRRARTRSPTRRCGTLGAGQRRLVEVARAIVGKPKLVLLDEPAAGLPEAETAHLGEVIRGIPEHTGALTILVDHDMSLVSSCCENTAVLDFGKMIASGPTAEVLRDEQVVRAYLGTRRRGGGSVSGETPRDSTGPDRGPRRPRRRPRRLARDPARRGDRAAGPQRRRQVQHGAGGRRRPAA